MQVFIHSKADVPNLNPEQTDVIRVNCELNNEHELHFVVHETENTNGVQKLEAKKRNCNFPWEGDAGYYPQYSYSACIVGCRRRSEMALCNCTRHLLPYTGKVTSIAGLHLQGLRHSA